MNANITPYPDSVHEHDGSRYMIARIGGAKKLVIENTGGSAAAFEGESTSDPDGSARKICPLSNANAAALKTLFPGIGPVSFKGRKYSIGLGDRLGLASPGHIRVLKGLDVFPVLAQQSMRELNLTGRTYDDVLSAAVWAVFWEGWREGWGADGDHLKTPAEIAMALNCGFTMITLDCSDHIDNKAADLSAADALSAYQAYSPALRNHFEAKYLGRPYLLPDGSKIEFSAESLARTMLVYLKAVYYAEDIYFSRIKPHRCTVDFELSIDETLTSTSSEAHFFVANELAGAGVEIANMAPRFCGEFQKGIDYIGDIERFRAEYAAHAAIAQHFGYRISVHSGSDKFSVFPDIGRLTFNGFHVKTAGTNWLEAARVIARRDPALYREMHAYALEHLAEARKYYHIKGDPANVPALGTLSDAELPSLMDRDDSRQIIHISYGLLLSAKNDLNESIFRDRILKTLDMFEGDYANGLVRHIGKHLETLGLK